MLGFTFFSALKFRITLTISWKREKSFIVSSSQPKDSPAVGHGAMIRASAQTPSSGSNLLEWASDVIFR